LTSTSPGTCDEAGSIRETGSPVDAPENTTARAAAAMSTETVPARLPLLKEDLPAFLPKIVSPPERPLHLQG
jgi:hypothetical protein